MRSEVLLILMLVQATGAFFKLRKLIVIKKEEGVALGVMPLYRACKTSGRLRLAVLCYALPGFGLMLGTLNVSYPATVITAIIQHFI